MSMDRNLADFRERISRIEAAHAKGFGFEAEGTLGRSHYVKATRSRPRLVGPLLVVVLCVIGMKGALLWRIGPDAYQERVDLLATGEGFDRMGSFLMQPDPGSRLVAERLAALLPSL
ncbi:hypothetical protein [Rhodobacter sp. NSM]|uniref:hypothetical protein n=1 Tax=Rhodobacter sp. NSM TaxID=3457501 RepID=UPI003FCF2E47